MAKFKAARGKAKIAAPRAGVPCLILLISGLLLLSLLFYMMIKSS